MKQEEKEKQLREAAEKFLDDNSNLINSDSLSLFVQSEAAKAYHQQKRFVRTENGTTLLELVFRKVDEHIKFENKNGWWDEYKGLMLKAEQEQTESVNLDELMDKIEQIQNINYKKFEGVNECDLHTRYEIIELIRPHLQPQEQKQSDAVEFAEWTCINDYFFQQCDKRWFGRDQYLVANTTEELYHQFLTSKTK